MVARECQRTKEKLGIARSLTLERASERDQAVSMAREVGEEPLGQGIDGDM